MRELFTNEDPGTVWAHASEIIRCMDPAYDFQLIQSTYDDVLRVFSGNYPGYLPIQTHYHDLGHTLSVFLCAVRLMHGVHLSGTRLNSEEISLVMIAALMHDIGYAKVHGDETGTGAQYTRIHVDRGIAFMQHYLPSRRLPAAWEVPLEYMIRSTDHMKDFSKIDFPDARTRMLGQIVGTADLVGQMADHAYLEKLLFLYIEFKEAHLGNYENTYALLCKTREFYNTIQRKLDSELDATYTKLTFHFKEWFGVERNCYLESMERNLSYLSRASELGNEEESLAMLRRNGIVKKAKAIAALPA